MRLRILKTFFIARGAPEPSQPNASRAMFGAHLAQRLAMPRATLLFLALAVGACGAPIERTDGGVDAGTDAGLDAGTPNRACADGGFDLNDVTFIFPLPGAFADHTQLLGLDAAGRGGPLLPLALQAQLPSFIGDVPGQPMLRARLDESRVIAARVDPCFPGAGGTCRRQLRLVAQPVREQAGATTTIDAAVHLFYDLDEATFAELVSGLRRLKASAGTKTACRPLGIHPVMTEQGLGGAYAADLKSLIVSVAGAQTLSRVALMELSRAASVWTFFAFDVVGTQLQPSAVPKLGSTLKQTFNQSDVPTEPERIEPAPTGTTLTMLLRSANVSALTSAQLQPAIDEAFQLENPTLENPTTADCVSCHVSDRARRRADSIRREVSTSPMAFSSQGFDLTVPPGALGLNSQRALGYFADLLSVNQRVVNESAVVAASLNARGP